MRLISCRIDGFGRLADEEIEFDQGLNVLYRDNGWGKSTLAAFIRAMFYGLEGDRRRSLEENERKRYRPWKGGNFGGQLVFESRGRIYRIFRVFYDRESSDAFMLRDEVTGLISTDFSSNIGRELFGVDRTSFMKTVFIGQNDCQTGASDDINAMISRLSDMTGDMDSYESADSRLKSLINSMNPARATGSLSKRKAEIEGLERLVRDGAGSEAAVKECQAQLYDCDRECTILKDRQKQLGKLQVRVSGEERKASVRAEWLRLKKSAEEKRNEVVELENRYAYSDDDIRIMSEHWNKRSLLADSLDARQRILSSVEKRSQAGEKKSAARSKYMAVAGIILLFIAVVLALILPVPAFAAAASGGVLILFAIILGAGDAKVKPDQDQAENEMVEDLKRELKSDVEYIRAADEYFAGIMGDYDMTWSSEHVNQFILELMSGKLACRRARAEYDKALETLLSFEKRNTSIIGDMDPDTDARDNNLSNDGVLAGEGPVSMEKISRAMVVLAEKIENAGQRSMACKNRLDIVRESLDKWRKDKADLEELYMVQAAEEKKYKLLSAAREKLAAAKQTMLSRYSDPVLESFMRYHAMVTGESSEGYHVDADLNVTYEEEGMPRPQSTLSSGWKDLTGLCLRLALADAMYGEDKPFLILDDSFSNFDDHNMKGIAGLIGKVSESYQIVYMTCSSSRDMKGHHLTLTEENTRG